MPRDSWKSFLFITVPLVAVLGALLLAAWTMIRDHPMKEGKDINRRAWELSYQERGLELPKAGPREGYWGSNLGAKVRDPLLGWHEPRTYVPGMLDFDEFGRQHFKGNGESKIKVVILGGSAAMGAYASEVSKTYFHVIGTDLARKSMPADITVIAAGAWKSSQELRALKLYLEAQEPDLIVFLNGLNDLTSGATSAALFNEKTATLDGSPWHPEYHTHDYAQRVADYLNNMAEAAGVAGKTGCPILFVLQPSLAERKNRSPMEDIVLNASLKPHKSASSLRESYEGMRKGLQALAQRRGVYFLDCSAIFDNEEKTTFADLWHFSDPGHRILGAAVAEKIGSIPRNQISR